MHFDNHIDYKIKSQRIYITSIVKQSYNAICLEK